jgi:hypothetical protein
MPLRFSAFICIALFLLTSFTGRISGLDISYDRVLGIPQACIGNEAVIRTKVDIWSDNKIHLHSFSMREKNFKVFYNGRQLQPYDLVLLSKKDYVELEFRYIVEQTDSASVITFSTDAPENKAQQIRLNYHQYTVQRWQMMQEKPVEIDLTGGCNDSLRVYFEYGGTVSGVSMYRDSFSKREPDHYVNYGLGDIGNFIVLTPADTGMYEVRFSSCHIGYRFKLHVR